MRYVAGIDIGAGFTKAVVLAKRESEARPRVLGHGIAKSGVNLERASKQALDGALTLSGLLPSDVSYIATTGFGRYGYSGRDIQITEITSAARGAHFLFPDSLAVLDLGAQSTRTIGITDEGKVRVFKTNDKCAAGSGSFIVRAAKYLNVELADVGELAMNATNPQPISSVCAVLAESEIINLVSGGVSIEDIMRGIYDSLADRASTLLRRVGLTGEVTFIGGVAKQKGMVRALEDRLKARVNVPQDSEFVCALGAALLGLKRVETAVTAAA